MKHSPIRMLVSLMLVLLMLLPAFANAENANFTSNQTLVFETIKWSNDFPKNAQILQATEYLCKIDDMQLHLLLVQATQNETVLSFYDNSATLMLIDLDSDSVITYSNCAWPENSEIATKEDALNMIFACWDSYTRGYNAFVFADHEITFPLSAEETEGINTALTAYFTKPE